MNREQSSENSAFSDIEAARNRTRNPSRNFRDESFIENTTPNPVSAPLHLNTTEFTTSMVHFYRGEMQRANAWRGRLDTTTNWAVITAGATLSFVFSNANNPHFAIPLNSILVAIFLFMEARRYRYYEVWASRIRVFETGYFAPMLAPQSAPPDKEWAEHLATDLMTPHFTISEWEAVGRRLRSNYLWLFILLALSWSLKVYIHPFPAPDWDTFLGRADIGIAPGWLIIAVGIFFNVTLLGFAILTIRLKDATSEVLPHSEFNWHPLRSVTDWTRRNALLRRKNATKRRATRARERVKQNAEIHKTAAT
ncbi:MAG: DUF2270 domain-containing protein [Pyrinomonadaceae bacterium]|nr:DUF2270 domain-containing protein [Pyrinomonadaceae bacterium]